MGSGGTQLKAALDEGGGTPDTSTPQPTAAEHAHRTLGPQCGPRPPHGVVRANKLILSLLALSCFSLDFILANLGETWMEVFRQGRLAIVFCRGTVLLNTGSPGRDPVSGPSQVNDDIKEEPMLTL